MYWSTASVTFSIVISWFGLVADPTRSVASEKKAPAPIATPTITEKPLWIFQPKEPGAIYCTPCLTPKYIVISLYHSEGFSTYGRVYAINPKDGSEAWRFPNDKDPKNEEDMLPAFCSPVCSDGRIYFGEGFHKDSNSRMLCLDAVTGKKLWEFKTTSHTESTPFIVDGKVIFGAGDDGLYVLDAKTGAKIWQYTGKKGLHIDSNPLVVEGRIFGSSGFSRTNQINQIFCLDLQAKKELWSERVELSAYGSPAHHNGMVFFATGNSTFTEHRDPSKGVVHCRDAKTGKVLWDKILPDTVICKPTVDARNVYVSCWDGNCYALDHANKGEYAWKGKSQALDAGPGVASPILAFHPSNMASTVLYAAGREGSLKALAPATGKIFWALDYRVLNPDYPKIDIDGSVAVTSELQGTKLNRRLYVPVTLAKSPVSLPMPRLYCFEEVTELNR